MAAAMTLDGIEGLQGARVAVIGDLMLDRYVYGGVERISPEAPIAVLGIDHERVMLGGAGNVARNVAALGAEAVLVALCGEDDAGSEIKALLAVEDRLRAQLCVTAGRATSVKTRFVAGNQQLLRTDLEAREDVGAAAAAELLTVALAAVDGADAVVLSDYAKGVLSKALIEAVVERAAARSVPVIADPKTLDFSHYRGVGVLTPNRAELHAATRMDVASDDQAVDAAQSVIDRCGVAAVLVTRGARGMSLVRREAAPVHIPTRAREVFDVSGAGDTVVAALAGGLASGMTLDAAAELANVAAGVVVGKVGTAVVDAGELKAAFLNTEAKVVDLASAGDRLAQWRLVGDRIVFTNGCFDLIHPGHVALLAQAKAAGERLIVGLNSDASVKRLKGEDRPIQNQVARAQVLASFAAVDLVVIFGEDTPLELITTLRPEVLVKGADYAEAEVVGGDVVKAYGGEVVLAEIVDGHSTTGTISRMSEKPS